MKTKESRTANKKHRVGAIPVIDLVMGLMALIIISCAGATTYFTGSNDVSRQFESGEVLPGYRYYYGGPRLKPNAVVAIAPGYRLESPYWHEMDVTPATLKKLIDTITTVIDVEYKNTPNGARIFSRNGKLIGVWYSAFEYSQVRLTGKNQIYLSDPVPRLPWETRMRIRDDD